MVWHNNFENDNKKYSNDRYDIYKADFESAIDVKGEEETDSFTKNLPKYIDFVSWGRWNPDLFWDLITPEKGGIRLDLDQRVFLRSISRFVSTYGVFPRGYGKTLLEVMGMYHAAIFFPDIELSMTAQTLQNASKLVDEKHREIIKFYPLIKNEIVSYSHQKDMVTVNFTSGGRIDILANNQSTKGARRKRLNVEESAQVDADLFDDVLEPVVNIPRRTIGRKATVNPEEINGSINFFTTSWYRGTSEYERNLHMIDDMANLKGKIVMGSDWQLACTYGRGETKSQILDKKAKLSPTSFALNYESKWVGASDGALIDINKLIEARLLKLPELECPKDQHGNYKLFEYVIAVDVARSEKQSNNKTAISVLKIIRNTSGNIKQIHLVNVATLPNGLNYTEQSIEVKRVFYSYGGNLDLNKSRVKSVVIDANNIGQGLVEALLKEDYDPETNDNLGCWGTINTEDKPEIPNSPSIVYSLKAQGINGDVIRIFIDSIESKKLKIVKLFKDIKESLPKKIKDNATEMAKIEIACNQTQFFIEEVANLKLKTTKTSITVVQVAHIDKDRYSSVAYGLYYISLFLENTREEEFDEDDDYVYY
jgi:ribonucleoside-diphosphate reductase alpha chain